jgi:hypothetical protein
MKAPKFFKNNPSDKIWWVDNLGKTVGEFLFTFDKKKIYNMFQDYPQAMTPEEVEIFDKENPFWAEFFAERKEKPDEV